MKNALLSNGGWLLRVLTVSALVATVGLSLFPRFVAHISTSAVVNAPLLVIRSPIEGVVEDYSLQNGAFVSRGDTVAVFREAGTDLTQRADLETRLAIASAAVDAVSNRIVEVEAIRDALQKRDKTYAAWHIAILEKKVEELEALVRGETARLVALRAEADRTRVLFNRKMVSQSENMDAIATVEEQNERRQAAEARLAAQRLKLAAMKDGVLAGTDGTNTPYTLQRQDEIEMELARLRDELHDHRAEKTALNDQLSKELEIYRRENRITLSSPISGVVWRSASLAGRPVLPGDEVVEILDCGARFLEAYLPEGLMGAIAVGDMVDIRLTGESRAFSAPVTSILGHGARYDHVELAAQDDAPKDGKMRVLIELNADRLSLDRDRFCHVGRTAQVSLPRDFSTVSRLVTRFSTSVNSAIVWLGETAAQLRQG